VKQVQSNRYQHYLPKVYLKGFRAKADTRLGIWLYQAGAREVVFRDLERVAGSDFFYRDNLDPAHPDALDDEWKLSESGIGSILNGIRRERVLPPTGTSSFELLMRFLADLAVRVPRVREMSVRNMQVLSKELLSEPWVQHTLMADPMFSFGADPERIGLTEIIRLGQGRLERVSLQTQAQIHRHGVWDLRHKLFAELMRRHWRILSTSDAGVPLVAGDNPVIVHSDKWVVDTGFAHKRSLVTVAVSPWIALEGSLSRPIAVEVLSELGRTHALRLNWLSLKTALREVFSSSETFAWKGDTGGETSIKDLIAKSNRKA